MFRVTNIIWCKRLRKFTLGIVLIDHLFNVLPEVRAGRFVMKHTLTAIESFQVTRMLATDEGKFQGVKTLHQHRLSSSDRTCWLPNNASGFAKRLHRYR
jgi:hypothetical protein